MHNQIKLKSNQFNLAKSAFSVLGLLVGVTAVAGTLAAAAPANADDNNLVDSFDIRVLAACTMTTDNTPGNTYSTSMMPGASTVLGDTSIKTVCNDSNGYSIYTVGFSGNSYTGNNNKLIGSTGNINTGTSGSDSYWAMKVIADGSSYVPTIVNGFDSSSFHEVPASFTQAVKLTSATDAGTGATGSNVKASYKISLSSIQVADTYTGKVKYVLVHPNSFAPGTYSIAYNANGGSGTMTGESGLYNYDPHTLKTSTFTAPSGYVLAGWCTTNTSQNACTDGDFYADEGTIEPSTIAANTTLNLYAIWGEIPKTYMQDLTASQCQAQATDAPLTVYDRRDNSDYTVRYINGACWMTQNLRITGTISATDSNFSSPSSFNTAAGGDLRGGSATYTAAQSHLADSTDVSASASATGGPYTTEQLGAWYNYCAASAGQVCSQTQMDATQDICPAGWRLPTNSEQSGITSYASAYNPIYGGYYDSSSLYNATTSGYWWSSTANNANTQYRLYYDGGSLVTSTSNKRRGYYIRCILNSS